MPWAFVMSKAKPCVQGTNCPCATTDGLSLAMLVLPIGDVKVSPYECFGNRRDECIAGGAQSSHAIGNPMSQRKVPSMFCVPCIFPG